MSSLKAVYNRIIKTHPPAPMYTFRGITDSNGEYSITYDEPINPIPNVEAMIKDTSNIYCISLASSTVNGFTIKVQHRNSQELLGVQVVTSALVNSVGIDLDIVVNRWNDQD